MPFMACEILQDGAKVVHRSEHDLESFLSGSAPPKGAPTVYTGQISSLTKTYQYTSGLARESHSPMLQTLNTVN
jgi:hypothetical protein